MNRRTGVWGLALALTLWGCGGAQSGGANNSDGTAGAATPSDAKGNANMAGDSSTAAGSPTKGSASRATPTTSSSQPDAATDKPPAANSNAAPNKAVLASTQPPPGIEALTDAETDELKNNCSGLIKHLRKISAGDSGSRARLERIHQLLKSPPKIKGTDVPRCAKLLERSVVEYRAHSIETEGINSIKRIMVGLSMAMSAAKPQLCPSAAAVPAQLDKLKDGPKTASKSAWQTPGWQCTRFDLRGQPQRFQYELRSDQTKKSYEIIARGYPVDGQPPVELFLSGEVANGAIEMSSDVYRRAVTR